MRCLLILLLLGPLVFFAQQKEHMNFQTKGLVEKHTDDEVVSIFIRGNVREISIVVKICGGVVKAQLKNLVYAELKIADIKYLARQNFVEGFEWDWGRDVTMSDSVLIKNRVLDVHAGVTPLSSSYTGKGVISGIIDTGIDPMHNDFRNADSSSRVLAIWDQTLPFDGTLTPSYGYGQEFDSALINTGSIAHVDQATHGTGVAGVIAGNGFQTGDFKGVAPESDIVAVELDFSGANPTASVDAFQYIYDVADAYSKPCVINASYGDYLGSHDGLDARALYLDSLLNEKPGRLFVAAAGNSGDWGPYHLKHTGASITDTSFTWFEPNSSSTVGSTVFLDIWGDTASMNNLWFSVGADHNSTFNHAGHLTFRNIIADGMVGTTLVDSIVSGGRLTTVEMYTELRGGQYNLQVYLPNIDSVNYNYSLVSAGTGEFDLWTISYLGIALGPDVVWLSDMVRYGLPASGTWPDIAYYQLPDSNQSMVSSFQCLENVVTVGQYVNRSQYIDYDGNTQVSAPEVSDSSAANSSRGPTRLGLMKPDVMSTGFMVMSALPVSVALSYQGTSNAWRLAQSGFHTGRYGTSFSSPAVAGIGALLLEKCPGSTPADFVNLLHNTSYADAFTGSLPNIKWGYGKSDAFALLSSTSFTPNITGDTAFCFGEMTTLSVDSVFTNYDWNGESMASVLNLDSSANGYLLVENEMGCKGDTVWYNVIEHDSLPIPPIFDRWTDGVATTPADSIQWYVNGVPIPGENDTLFASLYGGEYHMAEHIDSNGCSVFTDSILWWPESISENGIVYELYPNPATDVVRFESSYPIGRVELLDVSGKTILTRQLNALFGSLSVNNLANGTYFMRLVSDKESYSLKIQVLH